jgi:predicted MFS family arabinose efflux permease
MSAAAFLFSAGCLALMRVDSRPERTTEERSTALSDLREGVAYVRRTPWLWATLGFAFVAVFFFVGPFEVLTPFVISDRVGGGSAEYGILLATFGIGSAIGALAISSRPLPRRYLTVMLGLWGAGLLPLALFGIATEMWVLLVAAIVVGVTEGIGMVIWGTLLQRRVPDGLRGRVSSLDFFLSLALLPASMALAGPAAEAFGITAVFVVAALASAVAAPIMFRLGRLRQDELAHPLS